MKSTEKIKNVFLTVLTAVLSVAVVSCGNTAEEKTESSIPESTVSELTTEPTETAEVTAEVTEPETEIETQPETAEEITVSETDENDENEVGIPTNGELIEMINQAFGIMTDGTSEGNFQSAKDWDIIDQNADIDENAPITAEFLVCSAMRATGFVSGDSSMAEIIETALNTGVIDDIDISGIDLTESADIVEKAKYAWSHQEFENEIHVELADGVVDLNGIITADDFTIDGDTVKLPSSLAESIKEGTVYILPKNPDTGEGGAYKAQSVTTDDSGMIEIKSVPAGFLEVYRGIASN